MNDLVHGMFPLEAILFFDILIFDDFVELHFELSTNLIHISSVFNIFEN